MLLNCGAVESLLDNKEVKPVNLKGNHRWIFIGKTDAEAEAPIFWPPDLKSQLIGKDPDAGKNWSQEEKGLTEDEMVGWHHWLSGHEVGQTLGDSEGQGSLVCCSQSTGLQKLGRDLVTEHLWWMSACCFQPIWVVSLMWLFTQRLSSAQNTPPAPGSLGHSLPAPTPPVGLLQGTLPSSLYQIPTHPACFLSRPFPFIFYLFNTHLCLISSILFSQWDLAYR